VPCSTSNPTVKFADLLETARRLGADALATGHYVHSARFGAGRALFRPADLERDQSYFLFATTREQLSFLRFPLGPMTKAETRAAAREFGLPVAEKHDSQDICFVPSGRYADVIRKLKPESVEKGEIVHIDGRVLGRHDGIINYTVGQRRGIGVAAGEPLYVVHLDPAGRRVIVGPREALSTRRLHLRAVNWIGDGEIPGLPEDGIDVFARVRSTRPPMPARLRHADGRIHVDLADAEAGVAPGQACVFYDSDGAGARVLGGGFIERSEHDGQAERALRKIVGQEPAIAAL
jgi:tRNA-specific 2-thiouridylase